MNRWLEYIILYFSAVCFVTTAAWGIILGLQNGWANYSDSYLIPPGTFGSTPLYFPVVPLNLFVWSCFGFWLLYTYRARALPMFFFVFCIWDMVSIQFQAIPRIYLVVYLLMLALSWLLSRPRHRLVNVWTILVLLIAIRMPVITLFGIFWISDPWVFLGNQMLYDAVFFIFVWKSFKPYGSTHMFALNNAEEKQAHASSNNWRRWVARLKAGGKAD